MRRPLLLAWLASLPAFALLLGLGTWQVHRLDWKTRLLAQIAEFEAGPPQSLTAATPDYAKVAVTGRLDHGHEALLGAEVRYGLLGAHLLVPLLRPDAPPLLVDRGWVPLERRTALQRPEGEVSVTGYIRPGETRSWLSPVDDSVGRRFFTFDPPGIGTALGLERVPSYALVALGTAPPGPAELPIPARNLPRPSNSHLGYAITWYGLAAGLLGVLLVFSRRRVAATY
jgi:surfeit locus 1 family protein